MNPYSFSATSLEVAGQCLARYKAEFIDRGKEFQGTAASVGIVCHGTLEDWLRWVFIKKQVDWSDEAAFQGCFNDNFTKVFGSQQTTGEYEDAWDLCYKWYHREGQEAYFASVKVLSLESKLSYDMPVVQNGNKITKPFNYIMDRVDRIAPGHYRVVDYKSNRVAINEDQLHRKRQARYYALMIQIKHKDAKIIEVEFDFLRHRPVRTTFTREDNIETWKELRRATQLIMDAREDKTPETLNPNCGWCVRKASCNALKKNVAVGGILSKDIDELTELYSQLTFQQKAQKLLVDQIEMLVLKHAAEIDELDFETNAAFVTVVAPQRRKVNNEWVAAVLGAEVSAHATFSVTTVEKLMRKSSELTDKQKALLKQAAFEYTMGEPSVKIEPKEGLEW